MSRLMPDESEWKTRKRLIDPKLLAAGWKIVCYDSAHPLGKGSALAIEGSSPPRTARAEKLTQATVAKPFRGELVPTEAELARAEGRPYEPAFTLLARIQASRAMDPQVVKMGGVSPAGRKREA